MIRWFIRKKIDQLQTPHPIIIGVGSNYDLEAEIEGYGLKWKVYADARRKTPMSDEILDINVGMVRGPYCKNDYRKMNGSRTYFGRYKFKCPKCGYKKILLKNSWTLECEIKDEAEAKYRRIRANS